jgi:hypothetical protein
MTATQTISQSGQRARACRHAQSRTCVAVVLLVGAVAACARTPQIDTSTVAIAVAWQPELPRLRLPLQVATLLARRPNARYAEFGATETITGGHIRYAADREGASEPVPRDALVRTVEVEWTPPLVDSAAAAARRLTSAVGSSMQVRPQCFRAPILDGELDAVVWRPTTGLFYVLRRSYPSTRDSVQRRRPSIVLGMSTDSALLRPILDGATPAACPP